MIRVPTHLWRFLRREMDQILISQVPAYEIETDTPTTRTTHGMLPDEKRKFSDFLKETPHWCLSSFTETECRSRSTSFALSGRYEISCAK